MPRPGRAARRFSSRSSSDSAAPRAIPKRRCGRLIFDSHFDAYRGAVAYVRVVDGAIRVGSKIKMMSTGQTYEVTELGVFRPRMQPVESLGRAKWAASSHR